MLALRTGWTPDVIGGDAPNGLSLDLRQACHWALYAEAMTSSYAQLTAAANADIPEHLSTEGRRAFRESRAAVGEILKSIQAAVLLNDEDPDG